MLYKLMLVIGISASIAPGMAHAQKFNNMIANPFMFCSLPKPCKICQPWRAIYKELCADQKNSNTTESREPAAPRTPIVATVDEDGNLSYHRTVDGWTIRSTRRVDLEDASLNADVAPAGLEVIDGPIPEAQAGRMNAN